MFPEVAEAFLEVRTHVVEMNRPEAEEKEICVRLGEKIQNIRGHGFPEEMPNIVPRERGQAMPCGFSQHGLPSKSSGGGDGDGDGDGDCDGYDDGDADGDGDGDRNGDGDGDFDGDGDGDGPPGARAQPSAANAKPVRYLNNRPGMRPSPGLRPTARPANATRPQRKTRRPRKTMTRPKSSWESGFAGSKSSWEPLVFHFSRP